MKDGELEPEFTHRQGTQEENHDLEMHLEALARGIQGKPCLLRRTACHS